MNISELKNLLRSGDQRFIAETTGYTEDYVNMVLNDKRKNLKIVRAAELIIENRKKLRKRLKALNNLHKSN